MPFKSGESGNKEKRFTSVNQPENNGRPRKFVTLLKDEGYTKAEVMHTYAVMLSRSLDELKAIYGNVQATVLERTVANAIRKDLEKGDLKNIELILTRTHGAPKQSIETEDIGEKKTLTVYELPDGTKLTFGQ